MLGSLRDRTGGGSASWVPTWPDVALAAVLAAVAVVEIWAPLPSVIGPGSPVVATVVTLVACAALAFRSVRPLGSAVVVFGTWPVVDLFAETLVLFWGGLLPITLAAYSVARHGSGRRGLVGAAVAATALVVLDLRVPALQTPEEIVFHWLVVSVAWGLGRVVYQRDLRARAFEQRAEGAEQASREQALAAVAEERARIARELHDVVAHAVSVMVVQAGAAEQLAEDDPARTKAALAAIRATGTQALAEMRRLVGMLRTDGDAVALRPQPGVDSLPALAAQARDDGLEVSVDVEGTPRQLPAGLDLAAYRIMQEALTNVRRHSGAGRVALRLRYLPGEVELEIRDDGRGASNAGPNGAGGHGLVGMRERAALYGGRLETHSAPGEGFTVRAVLPTANGAA